jgi:hypothetical protein
MESQKNYNLFFDFKILKYDALMMKQLNIFKNLFWRQIVPLQMTWLLHIQIEQLPLGQ